MLVVVAMGAPRYLSRIRRAQRPVPLVALKVDGEVLDVPYRGRT